MAAQGSSRVTPQYNLQGFGYDVTIKGKTIETYIKPTPDIPVKLDAEGLPDKIGLIEGVLISTHPLKYNPITLKRPTDLKTSIEYIPTDLNGKKIRGTFLIYGHGITYEYGKTKDPKEASKNHLEAIDLALLELQQWRKDAEEKGLNKPKL